MTVADRKQAGRDRLDAVRVEMEQLGLESLLAFGSGRHSFIDANFCWWLSGTKQLGRDAVVALPLEGDPVLVTTPSWDGERSRRRGWIEDVVAVDDLAGTLAPFLRERGWEGTRCGVAGRSVLSPAMADALRQAFDDEPPDADEAVLAVASTHDALGVASIERASAIAEEGYRHLLATARPGIREFELAAEADAHIRALGADDNFLLISASQHNRSVHAPTDRELAEGDVILAEISPSVDGQFAQICRSAVIGPSNAHQESCYAVLQEALQAGLERAGPGVPVAEVTRAIDEVVTGHGYGKYTRPPYMRSRGHAMGLGLLLPADVSDRSDVVLEPGMAFVLHPNQYFPEPGYLLCGTQVLITADGCRPLTAPVPTLDVIEEL